LKIAFVIGAALSERGDVIDFLCRRHEPLPETLSA
jgi:hypothetical protein